MFRRSSWPRHWRRRRRSRASRDLSPLPPRRGTAAAYRGLMTDPSPQDGPRFSGLRALFVNCTLKRSPDVSNTQGLIDRSVGLMEKEGVSVDQFRAVDHDIATGVYPDMTEHGWPSDEWPQLFQRVLDADILVLAGPIWLG